MIKLETRKAIPSVFLYQAFSLYLIMECSRKPGPILAKLIPLQILEYFFYRVDNLQGDDDPMDICELGTKELQIGEVCRVRILGAFCVEDEHRFDWKVIGLNENEADSKNIKNLSDYEKYEPKKVEKIMYWFNQLKRSQAHSNGNQILLNNKVLDSIEAITTIRKANEAYKNLISGKIKSDKKFWLPSK